MLVIIQARMSSTRLPGKVLMNIAGQPMLERVIDRVMQSNQTKKVVVATSDHASDDQIEQFCDLRSISCFRGGLDDVAGRFLAVIRKEGAEEFVRISGDSPLIDPKLIDIAVTEYRCAVYDLVTNVLYRTFPRGQSVELLRSSSFKKMYDDLISFDDREHVTKWFYRNKLNFKIKNFAAEIPAAEIQLSVDNAEDLKTVTEIINSCDMKSAGWRDFVRLMPRVRT
jgi:spore coat polysaccharide biosynthesis protein SpsF